MTIQALQMALKESKSRNMHESSNQLPSQKFTKSTITMSALDVTIVCWPIIYKNNSVRFLVYISFKKTTATTTKKSINMKYMKLRPIWMMKH